jgi:Flp pilus assembly protein CpaB
MKGSRARGGGSLNLKVLVILALTVLLAGAAALFFLSNNRNSEPTQTAAPVVVQPATVDVLVAIQSLDEGVELKPGLFRRETRPAADFVGVGVVGNFEQLQGAYSKSFIAPGQPLLADHLTFRPPVNSVVPQIRMGYRAITIKLDKQVTNEGWARAGVRVDVLWASKQDSTTRAVIIAQNLRVLSSGMSVSSEFGGESKMIQNGESTVTLEVSAEDQKRLKLAAGKGEMRLLLRGDEDSAEYMDKTGISVEQILGGPTEGSEVAPTDQGWVVIDGRKYRVVGTMLMPG